MRLEIQVQGLSLPVAGAALDHHGAVGIYIVQQWHRLLRVGCFRQAMAQRAVGLQHATLIIQINVQAGVRGGVCWRSRDTRRAAQESIEKPFPRVQNCRLAWAESVVGKLGTVPKPGRTRKGRTLLRLSEG